MSDFEFIFALYGLLLGLSLTEVLGGLGRVIEARLKPGSTMRVGWLTPLMAAFLLLDLLSFWAAAWAVRDIAFVSGHSLLAVTAFAGAYYLAAALTFPREIAPDDHLDEHFFRMRRIVIGAMLALLLCQAGWYLSVPELAGRILRPLPLAMTVVLVLLMAAAMLVRHPIWARLVMIALVARYLLLYLI